MNDVVRVAVIAASAVVISGLIGALASVVASIIAAHYGRKNSAAIQEVHLSLNSRLEELIEASHYKGQVEERDRAAADPPKPAKLEP